MERTFQWASEKVGSHERSGGVGGVHGYGGCGAHLPKGDVQCGYVCLDPSAYSPFDQATDQCACHPFCLVLPYAGPTPTGEPLGPASEGGVLSGLSRLRLSLVLSRPAFVLLPEGCSRERLVAIRPRFYSLSTVVSVVLAGNLSIAAHCKLCVRHARQALDQDEAQRAEEEAAAAAAAPTRWRLWSQ